MFKSVLVPIDGSDHAIKALAIASDLAAKYGAKVTLLHVIEDDEVPEELARYAEIEKLPKTQTTKRVGTLEATPHGPVPVPGGRQEAVDRRAVMHDIAKRILEEARGVAKHHGVTSVDVLMEEGDPARHILENARRGSVDGIVMGNRGLGRLKGAIAGSVSHKVCHHADCTCITVT